MGRIRDILSKRFGRLHPGLVAVLATFGGALVLYVASGSEIFSPGPLNDQPRRDAVRGGVSSHGDLVNNCSACHAPAWSGETMADRCLVCHTNVREQLRSRGPMHGRLADGTQCMSCHTEHHGPHGALTSPHALATFDHDCAAFRLTGAHRAVDCRLCHATVPYQGTSQDCAACHADPPVHLGRFGLDCARCHSTTTFVTTPAKLGGLDKFDHDLAAFKLTGKHRTIDCRSCHKEDTTFRGTPQTCVSCHAEPEVHGGRFGVACNNCHSTATWTFAASRDTGFNHDLTAFKLTGKHRTTDCAACHMDSAFKGTPQSCVGCHAEPTVHKGRFSKRCDDCHTTHTWDGAFFTHTIFSMTHRGANNNCASCHNNPDNLKTYTCYNCHHHTPEKEALRHARRKVANLDNCIACHGAGRRGGRAALEGAEPFWATALAFAEPLSCPVGSSSVGLRSEACPVAAFPFRSGPLDLGLQNGFGKAAANPATSPRHLEGKHGATDFDPHAMPATNLIEVARLTLGRNQPDRARIMAGLVADRLSLRALLGFAKIGDEKDANLLVQSLPSVSPKALSRRKAHHYGKERELLIREVT